MATRLASVLFAAAFALPVAAPGRPGGADERPPVQATLLDRNEYLCANCLFGLSDYYFCFDAGTRVLIGHEKIRTQMRKHAPVDLVEQGKTVPVRYDDKYIWVARPGAKDLKLTQDYTTQIFLNNDRCKAATRPAN